MKARTGAYWTFKSMGDQQLHGTLRFRRLCPFCNANSLEGEGETISHLLTACPNWADLRNQVLGDYIDRWLPILRGLYNGVELERKLANKILGGQPGGVGMRTLEDWGRGSRSCFRVIPAEVVPGLLLAERREGDDPTDRNGYLKVNKWEANLSVMGLGQRVALFLMRVDALRTEACKERLEGWRNDVTPANPREAYSYD